MIVTVVKVVIGFATGFQDFKPPNDTKCQSLKFFRQYKK